MNTIKEIFKSHFPNEDITNINERGFWLDDQQHRQALEQRGEKWRGRNIFKIKLNNGKKYCLKISNPEDDWDDQFLGELHFYRLTENLNVPRPEQVIYDFSNTIISQNYIVVSDMSGIKLSKIWNDLTAVDKENIYEALGTLYNSINSIKGRKAGLFGSIDDVYETKFPIDPCEFMLQNEIVNGSVKNLVENGTISDETHRKIIEIWKDYIPVMKCGPSVLIHYSAFFWTISLQKLNEHWSVSRLTGLSDCMWWIKEMNLALLKYPPCFEINETEWNSFLRTYTLECNEKLIEVMGLFVKSLHGTGTFYAPGNLKNRPHGDLNMQLEEIISKI